MDLSFWKKKRDALLSLVFFIALAAMAYIFLEIDRRVKHYQPAPREEIILPPIKIHGGR